ncbi:MAG TPA: phosphoribosylaminoimidazolesuccinocarboxamide synthase [Clostridiales bacterium UBA8153]|nr:phosphoribosylaminoimidazolesuccinocarboxamide synthase [Clostridiales bacterium UBA8153]
MVKGEKLYQGKAKSVFATDDPQRLIIEYHDTATAFDGKKRGTIEGKGEYNNLISAYFFTKLEAAGVPTHYLGTWGPREMLVLPLRIILVEVVIRNIAAGSLCRRLGLEEGLVLPEPILEFYYKNDALGDPLVNDDHIRALGLATSAELDVLREQAQQVNAVLRPLLGQAGLDLVDFKLEFGRHHDRLLLGDEISPDTCRFWDTATKEKLDKDRFRRDLGGVEAAYREVHRRLLGRGR